MSLEEKVVAYDPNYKVELVQPLPGVLWSVDEVSCQETNPTIQWRFTEEAMRVDLLSYDCSLLVRGPVQDTFASVHRYLCEEHITKTILLFISLCLVLKYYSMRDITSG
eukprot:GFUD01005707.1.p1 GENE.GFUD01005707.1~~GFUD01005707.1.p1  ORF type:complete len:109 (-),score=10.71 GFUD01005707.1:697-1023(-)